MLTVTTLAWQKRLEIELRTFDDDVKPLLSSQLRAFESCSALMREQPLAQLQGSKKHRYGRLRAQTFLFDVLQTVCPEVFILCALAIPVSDLSRIQSKEAFPELREWWKSINHPQGLKEVSGRLCEDLLKINEKGSTKRLRQDEAQDSNKRRALTNEDSPPLADLGPIIPPASLVQSEPSQSTTTKDTALAIVPRQSFVAINLVDLFAFLLQYQKSWPAFVVACPWSGTPLPSMVIESEELNGRLQFSVEMVLALINFQNGPMSFQRENT